MELSRPASLQLLSFCAIIAIGAFLRLPPALFVDQAPLHCLQGVHPPPGFHGLGYDENLYRGYVDALRQAGLLSYPDLAEKYVSLQMTLPTAILPPTRFVYIAAAYLCHEVSGADALTSLKVISSLFSVLTLILTAFFASALGPPRIGLGVTALMACAVTQIHMSQHALIDGVFGFFALLCLWLLWKNLQQPNDWRWLGPYILTLALLVLTKENALFAYLGLLAALAVAKVYRLGEVNRLLVAATFIGPLLGLTMLVSLCGSFTTTLHIYQLLVAKAAVLPYAIKTGDGPWYRYFVDLLLISPLIFFFALGAIFTLRRSQSSNIFLAAFVGASFLIMCKIRFGMNLRYANMWDFPLRFLAATYLASLAARFRWSNLYFALAIVSLCLLDLRQYQLLFVSFGLYELVPEGLMRALQILK